MNIYLIGYRCTGKSTVGRWLADRLGWEFVDSDEEIVRTHGMTIQHIVAAQGWQGFREKEKRVMERICALDRCIVGTGGGVVLDEDTVRRMQETGVVFWLQAGPETIRQRMKKDEAAGPLRPSLTSTAADQEVEEVLLQREPLYRHGAEFEIETDGLSPEAVGERILHFAPLGDWEAGKPGDFQ
jgi:shikimate kinase